MAEIILKSLVSAFVVWYFVKQAAMAMSFKEVVIHVAICVMAGVGIWMVPL